MISEIKIHFDQRLSDLVSSWTSPSAKLLEAVAYVTLAPSKRLRPLLVYATGEVLGLSLAQLDSIALAVELMHTYSLVHDDLPAMDDDDLRRAQPSCHIKFDEAVAILVGDALQGMAFETLLSDPLMRDDHKVTMALQLQQAAGYQGMIAGQLLDIQELSEPALTPERLAQIHLHKTGALIQLCLKLPTVLVQHLAPVTKKRLEQIASSLGLGFQIQDDYLDYYGDTSLMGKPQGSDHNSNKKTFADFYSQADLAQLFSTHYQHAQSHASSLSSQSLCELIGLLQNRQG